MSLPITLQSALSHMRTLTALISRSRQKRAHLQFTVAHDSPISHTAPRKCPLQALLLSHNAFSMSNGGAIQACVSEGRGDGSV